MVWWPNNAWHSQHVFLPSFQWTSFLISWEWTRNTKTHCASGSLRYCLWAPVGFFATEPVIIPVIHRSSTEIVTATKSEDPQSLWSKWGDSYLADFLIKDGEVIISCKVLTLSWDWRGVRSDHTKDFQQKVDATITLRNMGNSMHLILNWKRLEMSH